MARPKRTTQTTNSVGRTIERVAIATLAAIVTQGSDASIAVSAVVIFLCVVIVEELGRRWVWHGKRVTLRDVALSTVGELRLQRDERRRRRRKRRRRARARSVGSLAASAEGHAPNSEIQE